jgi:hypothetical protein
LEKAVSDGYHCRLKEQNMKRALLLVLILLLAAAGAFASPDFATFETSFNQFAQDLANGLPFNSSIGQNWSSAYIGQFPHFGLGVTLGATTIPYTAISQAVAALGITLPSDFSWMAQSGVPIPAYTIDARIGGFILPFDIGLKVGYIPPGGLKSLGVTSFTADYLLAGADVRFALLKEGIIAPAISVGVGYNYMKGSIGVPGLLGGSPFQITNWTNPVDSTGGHTLAMTDPSLNMQWSTNVVELKAQISKKILFITPYIGGAVSYSFGAQTGGGVQSSLTLDGGTLTQGQIDAINQAYANQGQSITISGEGITVLKNSLAGFDYRVFGGLSFDIIFFYIDLGAAYDFANQAYGASANLRIAL